MHEKGHVSIAIFLELAHLDGISLMVTGEEAGGPEAALEVDQTTEVVAVEETAIVMIVIGAEHNNADETVAEVVVEIDAETEDLPALALDHVLSPEIDAHVHDRRETAMTDAKETKDVTKMTEMASAHAVDVEIE